MLPTDLRKMCEPGGQISLKLPGTRPGFGRRLCGRRGPIGHIICGRTDYQIVRFDADAVLRFLDQHERSDDE